MTMSASELQAYVDAGRVPSTSGTSSISTTITLDGSSRVIFEPNSFVWTGSGSRSLFEYDFIDTGNSQPIIFDRVKAVSAIDGSSIFRTMVTHDTPHNTIFDTCQFEATGAYCIDMNNIGYTVVPVFRNMVTAGSGALRLRASGGVDYWHGTSQMVISGWTHTGAERVGPAWNFRGTSGLLMKNCVDKGAMGLKAAMNNVWEGPLTILIQAVRTPAQIINLITDWDDANDDDAVNCYIGELRTDLNTGTGQHEYVDLVNATLTHAAIDAAVNPWRIMGGDTLTQHAMVVNVTNCESPKTSNFLLGGKAVYWVTRPWYKPGEESDAATIESFVTNLFPDSYKDAIETSTTKIPSDDTGTATTYSGSQNETDYEAEPSQYETILEG